MRRSCTDALSLRGYCHSFLFAPQHSEELAWLHSTTTKHSKISRRIGNRSAGGHKLFEC
jgi:hypothetical protein